jgi:G:T-mismatch repair DNA endonuclease (very short patch repair protein)
MQANTLHINTTMNINDLDNIRGKRNLINFAKQHGITGYNRCTTINGLQRYIRRQLAQGSVSRHYLDNVKGKRNLIKIAKEHNITGCNKYKNINDLRDYIKHMLDLQKFKTRNLEFAQPADLLDVTNGRANLIQFAREHGITGYSKYKNESDLRFYIRTQFEKLPFVDVPSSDDAFIPNPPTDDNYNNVINLSRMHEPEIYFAENDNFHATELGVREANENIAFSDASYRVEFNVVSEVLDFFGLHDIIAQIIAKRKAAVGFREGVDRINFVIANPNLQTRAFSTGFSTIINYGTIINQLEDIMNSDQNVTLEDTTFYVQIVKMPTGGRPTKIINFAKDVRTKRSILQIKNPDDVMCGSRAVIAALTYHTNIILNRELGKNDIKNIKDGRKLQKDLAIELCNKIIHDPGEPFDLAAFISVEEYFKNVCIKIICAENFNKIIYEGIGSRDITKYLYKNKNHFDVITNCGAFYGMENYCHLCDTPYKHKNHKCKKVCVTCKHPAHSGNKSAKYCNECNRYCYNEECFEQHKKEVCQTVYKCLECNKLCPRGEDHICGREFCVNCKKNIDTFDHECYMQWKKGKGGICVRRLDKTSKIYGCEKCTPNNVHIVHTKDEINEFVNDYIQSHYDDEDDDFNVDGYTDSLLKEKIDGYMYKCKKCKTYTQAPREFLFKCKVCLDKGELQKHTCTYSEKYIQIDFEANQETGEHKPNYVVAEYLFRPRVNNAPSSETTKFHFSDCNKFCEWLISREHQSYTVIAHNARSYDWYFIMNYCMKNSFLPYTIYKGCQIMSMTLKNLHMRFIDSYNFVSQPLYTFPETFGLKELKKGYFPHWFNTTKNQNYVGPMPHIKYYGDNTMKDCDKCKPEDICKHWHTRNHFLQWYKERTEENCVFDFQKEMSEYCESDVDILTQAVKKLRQEFLNMCNIDPFRYTTISSVAMAVYRYKHIKSNTIAVLKDSDVETYSKKSISWIRTLGDNIKHALNGGEKTVLGRKVDGFDKTTNTVYQFHGCFWHGCPNCYKEDTINNKKKESMGDLYEKTKRFTQQLRDNGYKVVEMWECEWKPTYAKIKKEINDIVTPINPRDAYCGGRTNASKLSVKGKKLKYIDICSLYPTVMNYDKFPVGHPTKIFNPKSYDPKWFGLIKCELEAPRKLYHPVLPVKKDKLLFALCLKCAEEKNQTCTHTDKERQFSGTWTTVEIIKAIEKGYKITKIYEVWHFEKTSTNLFKSYIAQFLKIKLETSEWENDYESKEEYAKDIKDKLEIKLDIDNIKPNPVLRAIAKLLLNALYGKFGQRRKMEETKYIHTAKELYEILLNDKIDCVNLSLINKNVIEARYQSKDEWLEDPTRTNILISTFTTSYARLRLYDMLDKLGDKVVYYDTDSIIYIDDGTNTVKTG